MVDVFGALGAALRLDVTTFAKADMATLAAAGWIALLAGASTMIGQVAILMLNRITGARLVASVLMSTVSLAFFHSTQAAVTWMVATAVLRKSLPLVPLILVALIALAPFVFNFFMMLPYLGIGIGRLLQIWSYMVLWLGLASVFGIGWIPALGFTLAGWTAMQVLARLSVRPITWVSSRLWTLATGRPTMVTAHDILSGMPLIPITTPDRPGAGR